MLLVAADPVESFGQYTIGSGQAEQEGDEHGAIARGLGKGKVGKDVHDLPTTVLPHPRATKPDLILNGALRLRSEL